MLIITITSKDILLRTQVLILLVNGRGGGGIGYIVFLINKGKVSKVNKKKFFY